MLASASIVRLRALGAQLIVSQPVACKSAQRSLVQSFASHARDDSAVDQEEVAAVDPFLSKLQQQTEASYIELLARKDEVALTENEKAEEEAQERRSKERGEWGGPRGPEPTRFGDWEKGGRCSDF